MADQEFVDLGIRITPKQRDQIQELAQRQGYEDLDDYLRALIEADAKMHGEALALDDDEDPIEGFREGWRDALTGNIYPASSLWDD
jgi:Arc/MetJ-type ribon-helix-helix transcriptional regulator